MDFHFFILYFYIYSIVADKMLIEFSKRLLNYIIRTVSACLLTGEEQDMIDRQFSCLKLP